MQVECIEPGVDVSLVIGEALLDVGLPGIAEADEVEGEQPTLTLETPEEVPPEVRAGRVALE